MDKPSEQKLDHKKASDLDIGIHDYGAGGKREQLPNLWGFVSITGGSREQRRVNQNYRKNDHEAYNKNKDNPEHTIGQTLERIETTGSARENIAQPRIVTQLPIGWGKL